MKDKPVVKTKANLLPGGGSSTKSRILVVAGGVGVLLLIGTLVSLFLSRGNVAKKEQLTSIAKQQNELVRIADVGAKKARAQDAKNLAITTKLGLATEQKNLQAALKTQGVKVSSGALDQAKKKRHDSALTVAEQTNRFDEAFLEIMRADLATYQKSLKAARAQASTKKFRDAMTIQYQKASILAGLNAED
jgi:hypothetical protein